MRSVPRTLALLALLSGCADDARDEGLPADGDVAPDAGSVSPDAGSVPPDASGAVSYQTISPPALPASTPLSNPGIGLEQAAKLLNPSGTLTMNASVGGIATVRYLRFQWSLVERDGDNQWSWAPVDAAINAAAAEGKQTALSLMGHAPVLGGGYTQAIPAWYMAAAEAAGPRCTGVGNGAGSPTGCTYYRTDYRLACGAGQTCADLWTFNHNDPGYVAQQIELIEALRARYDTPAWAGKIAYVDVRGGIGSWTESHVDGVYLTGTQLQWPMPTYAVKTAVADAYLKFTHLPIIANMRNGGTAQAAPLESMWVYLCEQAEKQKKVVGWRTDGIDCTRWLTDPVFTAHPAVERCWRLGPVHGELCGDNSDTAPENDSWAAGTKGYFALNRRMAAWHFSGWNNKYVSYPGNAATYGDAVDEWRALGGYRLSIAGGSIPSKARVGTPFSVSVELQNTGVAPVYRRYYTLAARLHPQTGGSDVILPLSGDLPSVVPGEGVVTFSTSGRTASTAGTYDVSVGVVQDAAYTRVLPLKLAQVASSCETVDGTYWCKVGQLVVGN